MVYLHVLDQGLQRTLILDELRMANDDPLHAIVNRAYQKLDREELLLFLKIRNLPTAGTDVELASRLANHDFHIYHFPPVSQPAPSSEATKQSVFSPQKHRYVAPDLPVEIIADILDHVGDWELSHAVGVPTSLARPLEWSRATSTDEAMMPGYLPLIRACDPFLNPPTVVGAEMAIRFAYIHILEYFLHHHRHIFAAIFKGDLIPIIASHHGRISVLEWWKRAMEQDPTLLRAPASSSIADAIDGASRNGQVLSLDWWAASGLPLEYTEGALEYASAKNHIVVLDWWKNQHTQSGLPLKIGRVMDMASTAGHVEVLEWWAASKLEPKYDRNALQHASFHGKVEVLQWWLGSGLQLIFDQDALTAASRNNRPEVLEWWSKSGLPIQYRMIDIEEALEDAIGISETARQWWNSRGIDFNANDNEWTKLRYLNS